MQYSTPTSAKPPRPTTLPVTSMEKMNRRPLTDLSPNVPRTNSGSFLSSSKKDRTSSSLSAELAKMPSPPNHRPRISDRARHQVPKSFEDWSHSMTDQFKQLTIDNVYSPSKERNAEKQLSMKNDLTVSNESKVNIEHLKGSAFIEANKENMNHCNNPATHESPAATIARQVGNPAPMTIEPQKEIMAVHPIELPMPTDNIEDERRPIKNSDTFYGKVWVRVKGTLFSRWETCDAWIIQPRFLAWQNRRSHRHKSVDLKGVSVIDRGVGKVKHRSAHKLELRWKKCAIRYAVAVDSLADHTRWTDVLNHCSKHQ